MSSFTTPLVVIPLDDGKNWEVKEPFEYRIGEENSSEIIIVPSGFITDFASTPKIIWNIYPPWGKYGKAAVIHDSLYRCQGYNGNYLYTRKQCDLIMLEGMVVLKVGKFDRWIIYNFIRWFGQNSWDKYGTPT